MIKYNESKQSSLWLVAMYIYKTLGSECWNGYVALSLCRCNVIRMVMILNATVFLFSGWMPGHYGIWDMCVVMPTPLLHPIVLPSLWRGMWGGVCLPIWNLLQCPHTHLCATVRRTIHQMQLHWSVAHCSLAPIRCGQQRTRFVCY